MKNFKLSYKEALKQQYWICVTSVAMFLIVGWQLYPVNTPNKQAVFAVMSIGLAVLTFIVVRRATNKVVCNNCNAELYEIVERCKLSKIAIKYCPSCGCELNT